MKYVIKFFILAILFNSCNTVKQSNDSNVKTISFHLSEKKEKQSDFFHIKEIIPLSTSQEALIGKISEIIPKPSGFYIADYETAKQIVKFDTQGNILYTINKSGRGPGEYLSLTNISVDFNDEYLYIYDSRQKKMMCFEAATGEFVKYFNVDFYATSCAVLPDNKSFIFYFNYTPNKVLKQGDSYPQFVIVDSTGKKTEAFVYFDKTVNSSNISSLDQVFSAIDSNVYCFAIYQDIIYNINAKLQFKEEYRLDYLNDNTQRQNKLLEKIKKYPNIDFERNSTDRINAKFYDLCKIVFSSDCLYFSGKYEQSFFYLYNKLTDNTIDLKTLIPDVFGHNLFFQTADHNYFYMDLSIAILKEEIRKNHGHFDPKLVKAVQNIDDNANPIILKLEILQSQN